eukprot:TRINITY_DN134_c0_g1_i8.p2 TRINITY_DN134_c0_g1~~TRINITY_DN134_c0_g1_i8.p2  ORF type:complete len:103 (-),score=30.69 TRINITY_DN134_c0_g1_i8:155-463(-)
MSWNPSTHHASCRVCVVFLHYHLSRSPLLVSYPSSIGPAAPDIIPPPASSSAPVPAPVPVLPDAIPATDNAPTHPQDAPKEQPLTDPDDIDQDDFIIIERSA